MRFMIILKATADSEAGVMPGRELLTAMTTYNQELVDAGIMIGGEGLQPSRTGARVRFAGDRRTVVEGPFPETEQLVAGFWLWEVQSKDEAIAWVKRCPHPMPGCDAEIEIRQVFEDDDFGDELTPELRAQEGRMRAQLEKANAR